MAEVGFPVGGKKIRTKRYLCEMFRLKCLQRGAGG